MADLFNTVIYLPIYNLLTALVDVVPGADLGIAVIGVTLIVKLVIMPLSLGAAKTQHAMRRIEPELKALRERLKDNREQQAREMLALYKTHGINPFASILTIFIQLPILFGLYFVCLHVAAGIIDPSLLYPFVPTPETINPTFLSLFAMASSSIVLALLAGVTQFAYGWYAIPIPPKVASPTTNEEITRMMSLQMRSILPIIIAIAAYFTSGAIALYFVTSNIFMLAQEFLVRKLNAKETTPTI